MKHGFPPTEGYSYASAHSAPDWRHLMSIVATAMEAAVTYVVPVALAVLGGFWLKNTARVKTWFEKREAHKTALFNVPGLIDALGLKIDAAAVKSEGFTSECATINKKLDSHTETLEQQNLAISDIMAVSYGQMEQSIVPQFSCDNDGRNRIVNKAYARLVRCGRDELKGFGYRSFIDDRLNPTYISGFFAAAKQHRTYEADLILDRPDGTRCLVRVHMLPHPEDLPPATHWNGTLTYIQEYAK